MTVESKELLAKLVKLISPMDIPVFRRESIYWLSKNLHVRNSNHKNYEQAINIIQQLLKMGVR